MDILNLLSPILENIGYPVLIFLIWYVYHIAQVKAMNKIIKNNFEILKQILATNPNNTEILTRIENKIDNNLWCPILKREMGQGIGALNCALQIAAKLTKIFQRIKLRGLVFYFRRMFWNICMN